MYSTTTLQNELAKVTADNKLFNIQKAILIETYKQ